MISEKMVKGLTRQMNRELYSAYLYFGMASYAALIGLKGFEGWFIAQAKEEQEHARKFYDYINKQGARVILEDIETPPQDFSSGLDLFEKTLEHEKKVTQLIHNLVKQAQEENDKAAEEFLQWFVKEQIEEEATPSRIIQETRNAIGKDGKTGYSDVDAKLAKRK
jgi:ferritin